MKGSIGFESPYPIAVTQIGSTEWMLTHELVYHGRHQVFHVPVGQATDFASTPSALTWLVPVTTGTPAAVFHDYLWRVVAPAGEITYRDADGLLRQALGALGVSSVRRWSMWAAVRWGALFTRRGGHVGWWRDTAAVVGVTVLLLPLVTIPALSNTVAMLVFKLAELVEGMVRWMVGRPL